MSSHVAIFGRLSMPRQAKAIVLDAAGADGSLDAVKASGPVTARFVLEQ